MFKWRRNGKQRGTEKLPSLNVVKHAGEQQWWGWMYVCMENERDLVIGHQCMETAMSTDSEFGGRQRHRRESVRNCRILQIGGLPFFKSNQEGIWDSCVLKTEKQGAKNKRKPGGEMTTIYPQSPLIRTLVVEEKPDDSRSGCFWWLGPCCAVLHAASVQMGAVIIHRSQDGGRGLPLLLHVWLDGVGGWSKDTLWQYN